MNVVERVMKIGLVSPASLLGKGVLSLELRPMGVTNTFSVLRVWRGKVC